MLQGAEEDTGPPLALSLDRGFARTGRRRTRTFLERALTELRSLARPHALWWRWTLALAAFPCD